MLVNVLEHIERDVHALEQVRELVQPGGHVLSSCPRSRACTASSTVASATSVGTGVRTSSRWPTELGSRSSSARYVNSIGALAWWLYARQLRRTPTERRSVALYDRIAVPRIRRLEERRAPGSGNRFCSSPRRPDTGA